MPNFTIPLQTWGSQMLLVPENYLPFLSPFFSLLLISSCFSLSQHHICGTSSSSWRFSHPYTVKSTYMCPISLGRKSLSKAPGWKRTKRLFCCTNDRLYFILRLFIFFLYYLKQLVVIVCVNRKVFWLNLVTQTCYPFYCTFIMIFNMPLNF